MIISKNNKKKEPRFDSVNNELDEDTLKELRNYGYKI
jgi:hypothetical protein